MRIPQKLPKWDNAVILCIVLNVGRLWRCYIKTLMFFNPFVSHQLLHLNIKGWHWQDDLFIWWQKGAKLNKEAYSARRPPVSLIHCTLYMGIIIYKDIQVFEFGYLGSSCGEMFKIISTLQLYLLSNTILILWNTSAYKNLISPRLILFG